MSGTVQDGGGVAAQPQASRQGPGIAQGASRTPGGGHQQRPHSRAPQGSSGDHRHQGRIDAAAEAQQGLLEAAFADVVGHPQHQGSKQLLERFGQMGGGRAAGLATTIPAGHLDAAAGQLAQNFAVDIDPTSGSQHEAGTVEHQLVVAAHLIHVHHRAAQPGGGPSGQALAQAHLGLAKW